MTLGSEPDAHQWGRHVSSVPSGEQYEIRHGSQRAVITEVGGGLRTYVVGDQPLLDGYDIDQMCPSGRGQVLAPWPNRLEDGRYEFRGETHQVPIDEPATHNAIHGLVRWATWSVQERTADRVVVQHELHPQPGYPFTLLLTIEYALGPGGLTAVMTARNDGVEICPFGCGAHPYLTLGRLADELTLTVPARMVLEPDARGIPRSPTPVDGTDLDFRTPRTIGATVLDHCYTDLERDASGHASIDLSDAAAQRGVTVWFDQGFRYAMLFTGDPLPDVARHAVAVEPMTCPPNALRTGTAVVRLAPGESVTNTWGITPTSSADWPGAGTRPRRR
jgi:aldose 1-epimerase